MHELIIYESLEDMKYCCEWIGISTIHSEEENQFIIWGIVTNVIKKV